MKNKPP